MNQKKLSVFYKSVQDVQQWLKEISDYMEDSRETVAYHAMRGTLFALRDRLTLEEAFQLSAQLPLIVRGLYFEGYKPTGKPAKSNREEFINQVNKELQVAGRANPEVAIRAVFHVIRDHISAGEVEDVKNMMPENLRDLWAVKV